MANVEYTDTDYRERVIQTMAYGMFFEHNIAEAQRIADRPRDVQRVMHTMMHKTKVSEHDDCVRLARLAMDVSRAELQDEPAK